MWPENVQVVQTIRKVLHGKPEDDVMAMEITQELERVIARMQRIERAIRASRQPPSMLELDELKQLGREYARLVDRLANPPDQNGLV